MVNKSRKIIKSKKKHKKGTVKFKKLNCAPNRKFLVDDKLKDKSCYGNSELFMLKNIGIIIIQKIKLQQKIQKYLVIF